MTIAITFDPNDADDLAYIRTLLGGATEEAAPAPAGKKSTRAKAAPEPDPEPEEEAGDEGVTLDQCVEKAQELVAEGRANDVKGALANFGVKRVSELEESQYEEFFAAISEDSVV